MGPKDRRTQMVCEDRYLMQRGLTGVRQRTIHSVLMFTSIIPARQLQKPPQGTEYHNTSSATDVPAWDFWPFWPSDLSLHHIQYHVHDIS